MSTFQQLPSWGNYPNIREQDAILLSSNKSDQEHHLNSHVNVLPRGLGRSYGDSCLVSHGSLLLTGQLNHFLDFNKSTGVLLAEAGVSLDEILKVFVPKGWFLPVTPGTKFVTLGGAIANDVHGKNHHVEGCFSHHVLRFWLRRSDGVEYECSRENNVDLFFASIGGLGLTGLITKAEIKLKKIKNAYIDQEQIKFDSYDEFLSLSRESEKDYEYTVAWVDCVNGRDLRGIFIRGNHSQNENLDLIPHGNPKLSVPIFMPEFLLNSITVRLFNLLYYFKNTQKIISNTVHYEPFFYPLDAVSNWNKIYGKRGFLQYQFVIPSSAGEMPVAQIFNLLKKSGLGSFLAVLKVFGNKTSEGDLSFVSEGLTLALDFPNVGEKLFKVLNECDEIIFKCGGRIYPAKDARMSKINFWKSYIKLEHFLEYKEKKLNSAFSERMGL